MLRFVVRRAWVQRRLLAAVVVLVAVATSLMGFYVLLVGVAGPRAFSEQVQHSQPGDLDVTAYVVGVEASDLPAARDAAGGVVGHVLAPLHPSLVSTATSQMRQIGESGRLGYLATTDAPGGAGRLVSGRWPRDRGGAVIEAVAPDVAARTLDLRPGDRVTLGPGPGLGESRRTATVVIVGTFRGLPRAAAESDPLSGAGADPAFSTGGTTAATYGPFLVDGAAFVTTGFDVAGLRVDGHPDLSSADDRSMREAVTSLDGAYGLLSKRVGAAADITRVGSDLPETLDRLHTQQATTRSAVLVALLLDTILGLAALVLAGRLLADTRTSERELLVALGLGRGQQLRAALAESALLATASAILAVPAAALAYAATTHLPSLRTAQLAQGPTVTWGLVATVLVGCAALTLVLVGSPLVGQEGGRLSAKRRRWTRSGIDVLLLLLAVLAWWQLRAGAATAVPGDAVLVLAPALCLAAVTAVAVRGFPPLFALAAGAGARSRSLLPLALDPPALRLGAGTALVLLALASAAATFGIAAGSTWHRSQVDQADLRVGADLSLELAAPPTAEDAATVVRTAVEAGPDAPGSLVSLVTARPLVLGRYLNGRDAPPALVALDMRHADPLLRGRLDGTTWARVGNRLDPGPPVTGVPLPPRGAGITLVGSVRPGADVSAIPRVVVQDAAGFRSTLEAGPLPVDGRSHLLRWSSLPTAGQRIVAVQLTLTGSGGGVDQVSAAALSVTLRVPGRGGADADWRARPLGTAGTVKDASVSVRRDGGATVLTTSAQLDLSFLQYEDGTVLATAFDPPAAVPVAVSEALADATGVRTGGDLAATVSDSALLLHVVEIVPTVPSSPGRLAVLADVDTVSRALVGTGHLEPSVDAFWVSSPSARTTTALSDLDLGGVTTREDVRSDLLRGPMQVTLPVAYATVAGSAVLLLLAGAALVVGADRQSRAAEVSRLRALGLTRRGARRLVFAQHGVLLATLVLVGALIGGAAAVALDRLLVRSDQGTAPVPAAVLAWPWRAELLLVGGLVVACLLVAALAAVSQVGASDTAQLRESE
ncbi:hypothetical protein [Nocardioides sp. URHA0020]|uniref:hypothetical protein n=1 Tax=Nocardioides sp. URHA0020 TaxID=1380392 RepID=UPI0005616934|nr:hypothetical protein [Nocardioides sp. URHA0020]